jgi:alkaline phosphatase D
MDDRWYRSDPKSGVYYGSAQMTWLVDALRYSNATYKFICTGGQVLSDAKVFENYAQFPRERKALLDSLDKYNISGVVFLTGDRHHSEVSKITTPDGYSFYDITSSPLTSSATAHPDEPNTNRIAGSMLGERNFAVITISGPPKARQCKLTFKNSLGEKLYELVLDPIRK